MAFGVMGNNKEGREEKENQKGSRTREDEAITGTTNIKKELTV